MMKQITWLVVLLALLAAGCSRETLQRSAYGSLQARERIRCQAEAVQPCPPGQEYDDYQRQRRVLEQSP